MKKISMKSFTALVAALVFLFTIMSGVASAAMESEDPSLSISINYSGMEVGALTISEDEFLFERLPNLDRSETAVFVVRDISGRDIYHENRAIEEDGSVAFPMSEIPEGDYKLIIWTVITGEDGRDLYTYQVIIAAAKLQQGWELKNSQAIAFNKALSDLERVDEKAVEWFRKPSKNIPSDNPEIIALALSITEGCTSDYDKGRAVHQWVCENICYDWDYVNGVTDHVDIDPMDVLSSRKTICAGYSYLVATLLRASGVAAKKVSGFAKSPSLEAVYPEEVFTEGLTNHAWNEFYADGRWVILDATWDCGNAVENGVQTKNAGCESHLYFDPGLEWFSQSHVLINVNDVEEFTFYTDYPQMYNRSNGTWHDYSDDGAVPYLDDGVSMIPLGSAIRFLDGSLRWDETCNPGWVTLSCDVPGHHICLFVGYPRFYVDGREFSFNKLPVLVDGHVRVETRALFSALGFEVNWDGRGDWSLSAVTVTHETAVRP